MNWSDPGKVGWGARRSSRRGGPTGLSRFHRISSAGCEDLEGCKEHTQCENHVKQMLAIPVTRIRKSEGGS